jgi:hypothetical protein
MDVDRAPTSLPFSCHEDANAAAGEGEQGLLVALPFASLRLVVGLGGRPGREGQAGKAGEAVGGAEGVQVTVGDGDELGAELGDLLIKGYHLLRGTGHHDGGQQGADHAAGRWEDLANTGLAGDDKGGVGTAFALLGRRGAVDRQAGEAGQGLAVADEQADEQAAPLWLTSMAHSRLVDVAGTSPMKLEPLGPIVHDPAGQLAFTICADHYAGVMRLADAHPGPDHPLGLRFLRVPRSDPRFER